MKRFVAAIVVLCSAFCLAGEPEKVGPKPIPQVPPPGVPVPDADKAELEAGIKELGGEIDLLRTALKAKPALLDLIPDVQIYYNAVRYALTYNEFFKAPEIGVGKTLLK